MKDKGRMMLYDLYNTKKHWEACSAELFGREEHMREDIEKEEHEKPAPKAKVEAAIEKTKEGKGNELN